MRRRIESQLAVLAEAREIFEIASYIKQKVDACGHLGFIWSCFYYVPISMKGKVEHDQARVSTNGIRGLIACAVL